MEKGGEIEREVWELDEKGANFFAEFELIERGAVYSKELRGYILDKRLYTPRGLDYFKLERGL